MLGQDQSILPEVGSLLIPERFKVITPICICDFPL